MKRAPELTHLSHDHHQALDMARRLRRAGTEDLEDVRARFDAFWDTQGETHFEFEERAFTPALCSGDPRWPAAVARMCSEHAEIRSRTIDDVEQARSLGELLHDHVRFEERELFAIVEATLTAPELARLGREVGGSADDGHSER
jgi:hypothetical protein